MEGLVSLAKQLFSPWWGLCDRSGCELGSESCIIGWSGCFWDTGWGGIRPLSQLPSLLPSAARLAS